MKSKHFHFVQNILKETKQKTLNNLQCYITISKMTANFNYFVFKSKMIEESIVKKSLFQMMKDHTLYKTKMLLVTIQIQEIIFYQ